MKYLTNEWQDNQAFLKIEPCSEKVRGAYKKIFWQYNKGWDDRAYANKALKISRDFERTGTLSAPREELAYLANNHLIEVYSIERVPRGYDISYANEDLKLNRTITETRPILDANHVPHYLWFASEREEILLSLYLHLRGDVATYRRAIDAVWIEYSTYTKSECGYSGESGKFAARLLYYAEQFKSK